MLVTAEKEGLRCRRHKRFAHHLDSDNMSDVGESDQRKAERRFVVEDSAPGREESPRHVHERVVKRLPKRGAIYGLKLALVGGAALGMVARRSRELRKARSVKSPPRCLQRACTKESARVLAAFVNSDVAGHERRGKRVEGLLPHEALRNR